MMHTTYDGRQVDGNSEDWRAHCEATTLLRMSLQERRTRLEGILSKRGKDAHFELSSLIFKIWQWRQVDELLKMDSDRERIVHLTRLERATNERTRRDIETLLEGRSTAQLFLTRGNYEQGSSSTRRSRSPARN